MPFEFNYHSQAQPSNQHSLMPTKDISQTSKNQIPYQYLEKYIRQEHAPGYCVLLTGPWGAGKTYFIKNFQEAHKSEKDFLYVSLNGVQSIDQINDEFYRQLNPKLSGENFNIASTLLMQGLKAGTNIEIDKRIKQTLKSKLTNRSDHILIFDDLERCEVPLEELLGYLNKMVEHNPAKVILIANEQELLKPSNPNKYAAIKEKLIGITLELETPPTDVIKGAASSTSGNLNRLLLSSTPAIVEIFEKSEYRNLRHIKQAFLNFDISFGSLDQHYYNKADLMEKLLYVYLIFSIEIKAGHIQPSDIGTLRTNSMSYVMQQMSNPVPPSSNSVPLSQQLIKKYSSRYFENRVLQDQFWQRLFSKGYLSADEISEAINNSFYYRDANLPNWMKLWEMIRIDDAQFNHLLHLVRVQFDAQEIETLPEALHISGILLRISDENLISETKESIVAKCKEIIFKLKENNKLPDKKHTNIRGSYFETSHSLGYMEKDTPEFKDLINFSKKMIKEQYTANLPDKLLVITDLIQKSESTDYFELYSTISDHLKPYQDTPIFHISDARDFCAVITRRNHTILPTCTALNERYKQDYFSQHLISELDWLKKLRLELENEARIIERTISRSIILAAIKYHLNPAISTLEDNTGKHI